MSDVTPETSETYIVVLNEGANVQTFINKYQLRTKRVYARVLNGFEGQFTDRELFRFDRDPLVAYVEKEQAPEPTPEPGAADPSSSEEPEQI